MTLKEKKAIQAAVAYGLGYMCGKHRLAVTKKELRKICRDYTNKPLMKEREKWHRMQENNGKFLAMLQESK